MRAEGKVFWTEICFFCWLKGRARNFWLISLGLLTAVWLVLGTAGEARAEGERIKYIRTGSEYSFSAPDVSGDVLVWSEKMGTYTKACFFILGEGNEAQVLDEEIVLPNAEGIKVDDGIVLYRNSSKNRLYYKDLFSGQRGVVAEGYIGAFYQISGGKAVYLKNDSLVRDCYVRDIKVGGEDFLFKGNVRDLKFYNKGGFCFLVWRNDSDGNLYFMNMNDKLVRKVANAFPAVGSIGLFEDVAVYIGNDGKGVYRVKLKEDPAVEVLDTGSAVYLYCYEGCFYYKKGSDIYCLDMRNGQMRKILDYGAFLYWAANGEDFFWVDGGGLAWYAGVERLKVFPGELAMEIGEEIDVASVFDVKAVYKNGGMEDVGDKVSWRVGGEKVIKTEEGRIKALSPGEGFLEATYEGKEAVVSVLVDGMAGIVMDPEGEVRIRKGEFLPVKVNALYYSGKKVEITDEAMWESVLGNQVRNGFYEAFKAGEDVLTAVYRGFEVSLIINIEDVVVGDDLDEDTGSGSDEDEEEGGNGSDGEEVGGELAIGNEGDNEDEDRNEEGAGGTGNIGSGEYNEGSGGNRTGENTERERGQDLSREQEEGFYAWKAEGYEAKDEYIKTFVGTKFDLFLKAEDLQAIGNKDLKVESENFWLKVEGLDKQRKMIKELRITTEMKEGDNIFRSLHYPLQPFSKMWRVEIGGEGFEEAWAKGLKIGLGVKMEKDEKEGAGFAGLYKWGDQVWEYAGEVESKEGFFVFAYGGNGVYGVLVPEIKFADVKGHWAEEDVVFLAARHVLCGRDEGCFDPEGRVSRAEMAALLVRMEERMFKKGDTGKDRKGKEDDERYADVGKDRWYYQYVIMAGDKGWFKGRGGKKFYPEEGITREELAVVMDNFLKSMISGGDAFSWEYARGYGKTGDFVLQLPEMRDFKEDISPWARGAVANMKTLKIMQGRKNGDFAPRDLVTRAEAAAMLKRIYVYLTGCS